MITEGSWSWRRWLRNRSALLLSVVTVLLVVGLVVAVATRDTGGVRPVAAHPVPTVTVFTTSPVPGPVRTVTKTVLVTPTPRATTTAPQQQARCSSAQLSLDLNTDRNDYQQGQPIRFTATLTREDPPSTEYQHFSAAPCVVDPGGFTVSVFDWYGQGVQTEPRFMGVYPVYNPYQGAQFALRNGQRHTITYTWDGNVYRGTTASPAYGGTYRAVAEWLYPYAGGPQVLFHVDGPASPSPSPTPT